MLCLAMEVRSEPDVPAQGWVPRDDLKWGHDNAACGGRHQEAASEPAQHSLSPADSPIQGEADSGVLNTSTSAVLLEGNVVFTQGWRRLNADRVKVDRDAGLLELTGQVEIREPGILLIGEQARVETQTDRVEIERAGYLLHERRIRGTAESISRSPADGIRISSARYTTCEPGDEDWLLQADEIHIDESTGRASARGAHMQALGVPFFYAPYFQFIVDDRRATGVLYPAIGTSSDDGLQYSQPIYLNLAENRDITLTPHLNTKRGSGLGIEHRLLTSSTYTVAVGTYYPNDDINPKHTTNRWSTVLNHRGRWKAGSAAWITQVDFERVSDDDFLNDLETSGLQTSNRDLFLRQHASLSLTLGTWVMTAAATGYQSLIDDDQNEYSTLPRLSAYTSYRAGQLGVDLFGEWARFDHADDNRSVMAGSPGRAPVEAVIGSDGSWVTGHRTRLNAVGSLVWESPWGYIRASLGASYLGYALDTALFGHTDDSPGIFAPRISLDSGLSFERQTSLFGALTTQTLEPRIYYLYRDASSQGDMPVFDTALATPGLEQLFRDNRFVGGDRLEDANRLSLGIWSRYHDRESDREILSLGLGQSFFFGRQPASFGHSDNLAPELLVSDTALLLASLDTGGLGDRNESDTILEGSWYPSLPLRLKGTIFRSEQGSSLNRAHLELSYSYQDTLLKLAYTRENDLLRLRDQNGNQLLEPGEFQHEDVEQISLSAGWVLGERWRLMFLWREDLEHSRTLDRAFGLSYKSCCWRVSLAWRDEARRIASDGLIIENLRADKSILLSFEFFGLGGVGTATRDVLDDRLREY